MIQRMNSYVDLYTIEICDFVALEIIRNVDNFIRGT